MILGVPIGDRRRTLSSYLPALGAAVLATKLHRGGVVVQLIEPYVELPDDSDHDIGEDGGTVSVKEPVQ